MTVLQIYEVSDNPGIVFLDITFNICQAKVRTAIDSLSVIWKSDPSDKIKQAFFKTGVVSILLYGCTT